jgi:uncharacterized linocin/CFP29 family protein
VNHLLRSLAPITDAGWDLLDQEARDRLAPALAARKLVDFSGPLGWEHSATNLGRTESLRSGPADGVSALQRRVLPLVELRADFTLTRDELRDADRGADDVDLEPLDRAAHQIAIAEGAAVFHGYDPVITGIAEVSLDGGSLGSDPNGYPALVAGAVELLLGNGIAGPYGMALGPDAYRLVTATAEGGGYPLLEHLRKIIDGPLVWAPGVTGAVVVSLRGGDFLFESGQDLAIGYDSHDADVVRLYLQESLSFRVATPEAAVALGP